MLKEKIALVFCSLIVFILLLYKGLPAQDNLNNRHAEDLILLKNRSLDTKERLSAADRLIEDKESEASSAFIEIIGDNSEDVFLRYRAADGLGKIRNKEAVPVLKSVLLNSAEDQNLRIIAALALGNIGDSESIAGLSEAYNSDDSIVRFKILQGLARSRNKEAVEYIIKGLEDPDKFVKARAIKALGQTGDVHYVPLISDMLESEKDNFLKISCIEAIGSLGGNQAILILEKYQYDNNELLRINAQRTLDKLKSK